MEINNDSLIVANEPRISFVPFFHTNESKALTWLAGISRHHRFMPNLDTLGKLGAIKLFRKETTSTTAPTKGNCLCAHILVADDDAFQHLYYQGALKNALKSEGISLGSQEICLHTCFSGEELIEKLNIMIKCGCSTTKLVIIDYHMGEKKLNGVETAEQVRKDGYKGLLLLRTGETEASLKENHDDFEKLLQEKTIDALVHKADASFGKKFIHRFVSEEMRT